MSALYLPFFLNSLIIKAELADYAYKIEGLKWLLVGGRLGGGVPIISVLSSRDGRGVITKDGRYTDILI